MFTFVLSIFVYCFLVFVFPVYCVLNFVRCSVYRVIGLDIHTADIKRDLNWNYNCVEGVLGIGMTLKKTLKIK
jgi:hypothetical protein